VADDAAGADGAAEALRQKSQDHMASQDN